MTQRGQKKLPFKKKNVIYQLINYINNLHLYETLQF